MKRFIFGFFILIGLLFVICAKSYSESYSNSQIIRVGISDNNFSNYYFDKISVTSKDDFTITDNISSEAIVEKDTIVNIVITASGFEVYSNDTLVFKTTAKIVIVPSPDKTIEIVGLKRKSQPAVYHGNIEIQPSYTVKNKFAVVNILPIQTYLKGVVPNEMPISFGLEALKAQAVLARNYVIKPREKFYKEFDICDSTACQVYFGANTQTKISDKAVDETSNIVVMNNGSLILAVYSSTAGGHTESYKNVFLKNTPKGIMSQNIPYLIATPDNENIPQLSDETVFRKFYEEDYNSFDSKSPFFKWKTEWTLSDLESILATKIPTVTKTGFVTTKKAVDYTDKNYFGHLKSINVNKRGDSGKIIALTIVTDKNEFTIYKELIIRKIFMYNNKMLPSANVFFDFTNEDDVQKVVAHGCGFGHGVGMSQWGAGSMAKQGYSYSDIIHHYYKDVQITTLPINISSTEPIQQIFHLNHKKATLNINNNFLFSDLDIIINDRVIPDDLKEKLNSDKKIDIRDYIKNGKNTITIQNYTAHKDKELALWIEVED